MNITVTTTTKKLTKSLIKQMPFATIDDIIRAGTMNKFVLGFLRNVVTGVEKCALLEFGENNYALLPLDWDISEYAITRQDSKNQTQELAFSSPERREKWIASYRRIKLTGIGQIYI